ncbi:TPA: cell division topological specificity factor MinE [Candidatus Scatenecus faecavium]|uniref:Cell division topological specificity factor n=1 Tax=Candidatus Scatenecus faecavium TaxID=2840915 RepID=A0A9D1K3W5_9BACT|nr:cell division topological specificity factor MinE [Candidatus Scatenecus faecavium]
MKDIFSDLFNKVFGFFRQTEQKEENAKDTAVNRLRVVLMQDRTNLTPELLEKMRGELIELLSKYVEMDKDALELNFEQEGNQMALMLSIPVLRAKDEEEIEAAEEEAEAETSEKNEDESETSDDTEEECSEIAEDETSLEEEISEETQTEESNTNTKHSKSK